MIWSDDEDDDDFNNQDESIKGKEGTIFLIDATDPMFTKYGDTDMTLFHLVVKALYYKMSNLAISGSTDLVGCVLFGTEETNNSSNFKHISVVSELESLSVDLISDIKTNLLDLNTENFKGKYGHNNGYCLGDALWICNLIFSQAKGHFRQKSVKLFTNTVDPHSDNPSFRSQSWSRAKDLKDSSVEIEVIPLSEKPFDFSRFYKDIESDMESEEMIGFTKLEQLTERVHMKNHKQRSLAGLLFTIGSDTKISVNIYSLANETRKPNNQIKLDRETNRKLITKKNWIREDTGAIILESDLKKKTSYGGAVFYFDKKELSELVNYESIGLTLLGFKSKDCIKPYYQIKPPLFLYPDESWVKGSTTLFCALLDRCHARNLVMICRCKLRKASKVSIVALLPQLENLSLQEPGGFHVIHLPFADDIRNLDLENETVKVEEESLNEAKDIISTLSESFSPEKYKNPVLQRFYKHFEALALDNDNVEEFKDTTLPDENKLKIIPSTSFENLLVDSENKPYSDEKMLESAKTGQLGKITVKDLRNFLSAKGITTFKQKKAELIQTIQDYFKV